MIEAQLSQDMHKMIVTLNANMISIFGTTTDSGRSMHIGHIKSIETTTDKRGKHKLVITTDYRTFLNIDVDDAALAKVNAWVAEVQRARQALAL